MMEMKTGDVFDRWSILLMKQEHSDNARAELAQIEAELQSMPITYPIMKAVAMLAEANAKIWNLEASINDDANLTRIGSVALLIRDQNRKRIAAKKEIDALFPTHG